MEFDKKPWLGSWDNFEGYIFSEESFLVQCWEEAENTARSGAAKLLFRKGVKAFWASACNTIVRYSRIRLGGWLVEECGEGIRITWFDEHHNELGAWEYELDHMQNPFLEKKPGFVFIAKKAERDCPYACVIAMSPMEEEHHDGADVIPHLHFQFARKEKDLITLKKVKKKFWYATMCKGNSSLLEKCNIVRALHKLPLWEKLPENEQDKPGL